MNEKTQKGGAERVACTHPGCQNAGVPGHEVPVPDKRPGAKPSATVSVSFLWTPVGATDEAKRRTAALCHIHAIGVDGVVKDGYVPFRRAPTVIVVETGVRPTVTSPRPSGPMVITVGGKASADPRPGDPSVRTTVVVTPGGGRFSAPPVAPRLSSGDGSSTLGDLGLTPETYEAMRAAKPPEKPSSTPSGSSGGGGKGHRTAKRGPALVKGGLAGLAEAWNSREEAPATPVPKPPPIQKMTVEGREIEVVFRNRHPRPGAEVVVETGPVYGEEDHFSFFRANRPVSEVLSQDLSIPVGEMPEPPLVRKVEMTDGALWITLRDGRDDPEPIMLQMFRAIDLWGCSVFGYHDPNDGQFYTGPTSTGLIRCVRHVLEDGSAMLIPETGRQDEKLVDIELEPTTWSKFKDDDEDRPLTGVPKA